MPRKINDKIQNKFPVQTQKILNRTILHEGDLTIGNTRRLLKSQLYKKAEDRSY